MSGLISELKNEIKTSYSEIVYDPVLGMNKEVIKGDGASALVDFTSAVYAEVRQFGVGNLTEARLKELAKDKYFGGKRPSGNVKLVPADKTQTPEQVDKLLEEIQVKRKRGLIPKKDEAFVVDQVEALRAKREELLRNKQLELKGKPVEFGKPVKEM